MSWSGRMTGKGLMSDALQGKALVELTSPNGASKVLAFVGDLVEEHGLFDRHVAGHILGFAPLSGATPVTIAVGDKAIFAPGDQMMHVDKAPPDGFRLRYIDQQGAPWEIGSFNSPEETKAAGYDGQVIAWSAEYGSEDDPLTLDAATLPDVEKKIRDNQSIKSRRKPVLSPADMMHDDKGPIEIEDIHGYQGSFVTYLLANQGPKQAYTYYYAARATPFSSELVGPARSLDQLRGDVSAYRDDSSRAALLGLNGIPDTGDGLSFSRELSEPPGEPPVDAAAPKSPHTTYVALGVFAAAAGLAFLIDRSSR